MSAYFAAAELERFLGGLGDVWERTPHLFRQPFSTPLAPPDDYWQVLLGWAREVRAGRRFAHPRWIENDLLPAEGDGGLEAFCRRVESRYRGDWYLYQADGVQQLHPVLWHRLAEIVRPILARAGGLPPGGMMLDLFLGKYDRTPTGIHRDEGDVLAFVTQGPKRLHFWPREAFPTPWAAPERTHFQTGIWSYEKHLDAAITLEAEAGDVIYWPRAFLHLGAAPDHWAGMVTLTMWWQATAQRAIRYMVDSLWQGAATPVTYPLDVGRLGAGARALPPALEAAAAAAHARFDAGWAGALAEAWARLVTAYGFMIPPGRMRSKVSASGRYELRHPVALVELGGAPALFACGHRVATLPAAARALGSQLEALAPGAVADAATLAAAADLAPEETEPLLAALTAVGAAVAL